MRLRRRSFGLFTLFAALPLRVNAAAEISRETAISALTAAAYELFPHDNVDESLYGTLAETFFSTDEDRALRLADGLGGDTFVDVSRDARIQRLTDRQGDADFFALRMHVMMGLYNNSDVTRRFGYQGPSFEKGGYLERGFDDDGHHERPVVDWSPLANKRLEDHELGIQDFLRKPFRPEQFRAIIERVQGGRRDAA